MNDEIEIDIRKVILGIAAGWKWILGAALAAALVALIISYFLPTKYESRAIVAITNPRYIANFDPRYQTVNTSLTNNNNFLDLANSDEIVHEIYNQWNDPKKNTIRLDDFRKTVAKATNGSDNSIINLTITSKDPQESARLANLWADIFSKQANDIYGGEDPTQLEFFKTQLSGANQALDAARQALVEFQKRNNMDLLKNQLGSLMADQNETLVKQRTIRQVQEDARSLLKQVANMPPDTKISPTDELNWTTLNARYYSISASSNVDRPLIQLQIPATTGITTTVTDQKNSIQEWISSLDQQYLESQDSLNGIEVQVTDLQSQIQVLENEQKRLTQASDLASDTYVTLSHKTDEVNISIQQQVGDVRVAAQAITPNRPMSKNLARNSIIAGGLGAIIMCLIYGIKILFA